MAYLGSFNCDIGQDPSTGVQRPQGWEISLSYARRGWHSIFLPPRSLLWDVTIRSCDLDRAPLAEQALWWLDLNILVVGFNTNGNIFEMKASHCGQCMSIKSKLNPSSLETKLNNEGTGFVTKALLTPERCLDNWGVQYNYNSGNKYGSVTAKSARKSETLSLLRETPDLKRKRVGDGRTGITHKCHQERSSKEVPGRGGGKRE